MSNKQIFTGLLLFICLFSCIEANLIAQNQGAINLASFIKVNPQPLPKFKITLDVLLEAKKNGKLDDLEQYADQVDIEQILKETKNRYHAKLQAKRAIRQFGRAKNLLVNTQVRAFAADKFALPVVRADEPELVNHWDDAEKKLKKIWEDGKKQGNGKLRMLWVRGLIHRLVDIICDQLGIN